MPSDTARATVAPYAAFIARPADAVAQDLESYAQLLAKWQSVQNLVSRETMPALWTRHIADSLQILRRLLPGDRRFLDLGSGGGLPAVPLAIARKGERDLRLVLLEANGKSYVVPLEGGAVERLLARSANALGADVVISNGANATDDIFSLTVGQSSPAPTTASTPLMGVRGVVIARRGPMIEVATTGQQRYTVIVTASTRIVLAKSGLTRPQVRTGGTVVGHLVSVAGAVDQSTGRITAELVVVGAKYQPSAQGGTIQ